VKFHWAVTLLIVTTFSTLACGGGGGSKSSGNSGGTVTPPTTGGTGSSSAGLAPPVPVSVSAGAPTSGISITVPSGTPALNAEVLGVTPLNSSGGSASNTGGVIQRGSQGAVLLFGKGLNANLTVSVFGPNDLSISNIRAIKSTTGTPGVQFTVTVNSDAIPCARTVVLQDSQGNVTTFTGGLEIQ
jgi:hypothetical protein